MAVLNAATRNNLPSSTFALPGRRYPIPDASHARNALARGSQFADPAQLATIRAAVRRKFPGIGQKKKKGPTLSSALGGTKGWS